MAYNEIEFYDKIFTRFMDLNSNGNNKTELFKNQAIIELMTLMNSNTDKLFTKNALLLIMGLCDDNLNDTFYYNSENIQNATKGNKDVLLSILEEEFISYIRHWIDSNVMIRFLFDKLITDSRVWILDSDIL